MRGGMNFRRLPILLALCITALCALPVGSAAAAGCDKVAALSGSDSNAGTEADPYRTAQKVADSLSSGQTGCFRDGTYAANDIIRVTRPGITLTSFPGERATLKGRLYIVRGANQVTIEGLNLDGRNSASAPGISVNAADTVFRYLNVTNYNDEICFVLGNSEYGRAVRTIIEQSRIHHCGVLPATNQDHGIYVDNADGTIIRDNWIYDNADRGVQIYPDAQGTQVYRNVIDGNGEGIVISGDGNTASSNTDVHHNVISNSKERWNIESNWPGNLVGRNNSVHDNCMWASSARAYYNLNGGIIPASEVLQGFTESDNVISNPGFVNRAGNDFNLAEGSPCAFAIAGAEPPPSAPTTGGGNQTPPSSGPDQPSTGSPGGSVSTVVIRPNRRKVRSAARRSARISIRGRVRGPVARVAPRRRFARLYVRRQGGWQKIATVRLRANGSFRIGKRIRVRSHARRVHIRARVRGARHSRAVAIGIRRR